MVSSGSPRRALKLVRAAASVPRAPVVSFSACARASSACSTSRRGALPAWKRAPRRVAHASGDGLQIGEQEQTRFRGHAIEVGAAHLVPRLGDELCELGVGGSDRRLQRDRPGGTACCQARAESRRYRSGTAYRDRTRPVLPGSIARRRRATPATPIARRARAATSTGLLVIARSSAAASVSGGVDGGVDLGVCPRGSKHAGEERR